MSLRETVFDGARVYLITALSPPRRAGTVVKTTVPAMGTVSFEKEPFP